MLVESMETKKPVITMHKLYKAFWIVVIGGVIGYIVETIYCLLKNGVFESRQGLLYAPFSQIYGLGALLLVLATLPVKDKGNKWIFGVCAIGGGLFEFVCSWVQEYFLGVQSWDYPAFALSLTGRTSIIYMVFWGALGVFFTRCIYPKISIFIDRVLDSSGRFLTWIIAVFLLLNSLVTITAVARWSDRQAGEPAQYEYQMVIDRIYPDSLMADIYPQMELVND